MHDLRLAFRNLIRRPAFSVIAILTLALGIGANTAKVPPAQQPSTASLSAFAHCPVFEVPP